MVTFRSLQLLSIREILSLHLSAASGHLKLIGKCVTSTMYGLFSIYSWWSFCCKLFCTCQVLPKLLLFCKSFDYTCKDILLCLLLLERLKIRLMLCFRLCGLSLKQIDCIFITFLFFSLSLSLTFCNLIRHFMLMILCLNAGYYAR